jgi:predicted CXXCH cytochrome family protein
MRFLRLTAILVLSVAFLYPLPVAARQKSQRWNGSYTKYTQIAGATRVGSEKCQSCHAQVAENFRHAFHSTQGVECEDCDGAGSLHVAGSGDVTKIIRFDKRTPEEANGVCLSCHAQDAKLRNWLAGPHASDGLRCTDCHQIHGSEGPENAAVPRMNFDTETPGSVTLATRLEPESTVKFASRKSINDACMKCHAEQRAEMSLPYHHPLREGKLTCVDCHNPHGGPGGNNLITANVNQLCLSCHAQYRGPYTYQHPPVNESCLNCHRAHGSPNTNLLTLSEPALCLQCHAGHHDGANLPLTDRCTDCHGSVHGTDVPTPSGGTRFVDKGAVGVPSTPQQVAASTTAASSSWSRFPAPSGVPLVAAHATVMPGGAGLQALAASGSAMPIDSAHQLALMSSHSPVGVPPMASLAGAMAGMFWAFPNGMSVGGGVPVPASAQPNSYWDLYFTPGAYRFMNLTGYGGRVGEYDSLQEGEGGGLEEDYVSVQHHTSLLTRATVLTGSDFHMKSQLNVGQLLEAGAEMRSFVEQQDNYPFYSGEISPDIGVTDNIPAGAVFGVRRRLGSAYARLKVPNTPVHVFVKGSWQARAGETQLAYLDENIDTTCSTCHYNSGLRQLNYTTRNIGAGAEVTTGPVNLTYEHDYSSFNDGLPYPSGNFGPFENEDELLAPLPLSALPDTTAGRYYIDIPAASRYSADSLSLSWNASPDLVFTGQASYRRGRDVFTDHPQNAFDSDTALSWHPRERLRVTADYRQQNLVNQFVPYFALYGNMSYHEHWAGLKAEYDLNKHLDLETHYQRSGISRSNAFLWPQIYSPDNTDLLTVVPSSFSNTVGMALRYHGNKLWNGRAGYEWTGTHDPGYLIVPQSNNRIFGDVALTPARWVIFTNDASIIVQNAFPIIQRRNRFYTDAADATLKLVPNLDLDLGYSYQQNNLASYMAFQNDSGAGYVLDEPFVPFRELSQTYWIRSKYKFKNRLGLAIDLMHNSAHSGFLPDLNPNDAVLLGNGPLIAQDAFDPVLFQQALGAIGLGSTLVSQVNVPQFIGQGKVFYMLPRGFDTGVLAYYGSYRDYTNPSLNGILRSYTIYFGRSW